VIALPRLYAIADASFGDPVNLASSLFDGGARLVQVRNKTAGARQFLEQVESILRIAPLDARVQVNDRVDIALLAGAHGVHLGQDDLAIAEARRLLGPQSMIGFSTHNLAQAISASSLPIDYIAVGPVFVTTTKENPDPVLGLENLREICTKVQKPVVAIGGITLETAPSVLAAGAASLAVIGGLLKFPNVKGRTQEWIQGLQL